MQQAVGFVVRLYYAVPLISGQLDQPTPDGASLQRVGEDARYTRELGGRRYDVLERRFLLIAERSGPMTIPGARFQGQGVGGFFDDLFGDGRRALNADGAPRTLQVRGAPANASQPWLPLRDTAPALCDHAAERACRRSGDGGGRSRRRWRQRGAVAGVALRRRRRRPGLRRSGAGG